MDDEDAWEQTVEIAMSTRNQDGATVLTEEPSDGAWTNEYVEQALAQLEEEGVDIEGAGFEPIEVDATLTAELSADSMHELLLGTLPLGKAVLFRKLKVSGSRSRALTLEPLLHACQAVYPGIVDRRL